MLSGQERNVQKGADLMPSKPRPPRLVAPGDSRGADQLPQRPGRRPPETTPERLQAVAKAVLDLAEGGYDEVKMIRVAELAGISRASLYQHFSSRDDLIAFAIATFPERVVTITAPRGGKSGRERLQRLLDEMLEGAAASLPWTEAILLGSSRADPQLSAQIPNRLADVLRRAIGNALSAERAQDAAFTVELAYIAVLMQLVGGTDLAVAKQRMRMVINAVLPARGA